MRKSTMALISAISVSALFLATACESSEKSYSSDESSETKQVSEAVSDTTESADDKTGDSESSESKADILDIIKGEDVDVKTYLTFDGKSLEEAIETFKDLDIDGTRPSNYLGGLPDFCKSADPQNGVYFIYEQPVGMEITDYSKVIITSVWIENEQVMNELINQAKYRENDVYTIDVDGIDYDFYAGPDYIHPMGVHEEHQTEAPTDPPIGNSYGIYVSGNTELAKLAGNTLIEKAKWCGWYDYSYGYVLINGKSNRDGSYDTYSDISVAVNENPNNPYTGQIIVEATRCTDNVYYPLRVTVDWEATDYGDYYNFTWTNTDIYG